MQTNRSTLIRALTVCAALALAVTGTAAATTSSSKAKPQTGTWAGKVSQDISLLDEPYVTKFVVNAYKGRIVGFATRVRMECDDDSVTDAQVFESWRIGQGPKLSPKGSFTLKVDSVAVQGNLGLVLAQGTVQARTRDCAGKGIWKAKRFDA
jgi:hypothetical protein